MDCLKLPPWKTRIHVAYALRVFDLSALSSYILSLALASFPPGTKMHSLEKLPDCGSDPKAPTCELLPVCDEPTILCAPPRYHNALGSWVRIESRETGARRLEVVAEALADAATYAGAGWEDGPAGLAGRGVAAG